MRSFMNPELTDIFLAMLLDFSLGDPRHLYHPVMALGAFIQWFERTFYKAAGSQQRKRLLGLILWIVTVTGSYLLCWLLLKAVSEVHAVVYHVVNIGLIWMGVAAKSLKRESMKVKKALDRNDIEEARVFLSYIVGRDTKNLSHPAIIRASVETVAENTSDGVIAPLFYVLVGGAPLMWAYKAVNTLDSMVGYRNERYEDYGFASARLDDLFNYIPARLTAVLLMLSSGCVGLSVKGSYEVWRSDHGHHKSPNSGHPEAAVAGALGISLGGDASYFGKTVHKPVIGREIRPAAIEDIQRVNSMMYISTVLFLFISSCLMIIFRKGGMS